MGLGIDNIVIECYAPEIPIADAVLPVCLPAALMPVLMNPNCAKNSYASKETVRVEDGDKWAELHRRPMVLR